jgi:hypothetical protein
MSKLLWLLCILCCGAIVLTVFLYLKRTHKAKSLELQLQTWVKNAETVDATDTILVLLCVSPRRAATRHQGAVSVLPTLDSLFRHAFCPTRIRVGLVLAPGAVDPLAAVFPEGADQQEAYPYASRFLHRIRVCGPSTTHGPSPARVVGLANTLDDERFLLHCSSRAEFASGWDRSLVQDICGRRDVILTSRAASRSGPSFSCAVDMTADGFPILGARAFAQPPDLPLATLFAGTQELFGYSEVLAPWLGHEGLAHVRGDLDAFLLTLVLRMRGLMLYSPTKPTLFVPTRTEPAELAPQAQQRLGVHTAQAVLAAARAEERFAQVLSQGGSEASVVAKLRALTMLPWIAPVLGASTLLPSFVKAAQFVEVHSDDHEPFEELLSLSLQRAVLSKGVDEPLAALQESLRIVKDRGASVFPGTDSWARMIGSMLVVSRVVVGDVLACGAAEAGPGLLEVLEVLGVDPTKGSLAGRTVLGLLSSDEPEGQEMRERFGSVAAYRRERGRWTVA